MRKLLKFLHTMDAIGLMGAMACLLVMPSLAPPVTSLAEHAASREAMRGVAAWILFPSLGAALISGLLAIAASRAFHNAGWALLKAASGILLFESGLAGVLEPMQREAEQSVNALAGQADPAMLGLSAGAEWMTLCILPAVATANVVLGVWRPRFTRRTE